MTDRLHHRGPDDAGLLLVHTKSGAIWTGEGEPPATQFDLALGHRRLSILDLSPAGHQPMVSARRKHWVVYNGEIYNFIELRNELRALGHVFVSGSDTEVLLAAYDEWGLSCLDRFNGMWAFALWDGERGQLILARDRMGVKPLYYAHGDGWFNFGSEIKALLAEPKLDREPNDEIVYDFLSLRLADHTPETFFRGVYRVPASHYLVLVPGAEPRLVRYWSLTSELRLDASPAEEARAVDRFREIFEDAVRLRLRSDVPIGTCLSGGLDSSSIVTTANRLMFDELHLDPVLVGERQRTFSACFDDPRFDERPFIDQVIAATGASSHRVFPDGDRMWRELPALVAQMDEPFHSTSQYSQYSVMRLVRESGVTVTLDGQGADELMAGYPAYHSVMLATLIRRGRLLASVREGLSIVRMSGRGRAGAELMARTAYGLLPTSVTTPVRTAVAPQLSSYSPEGRSLQVIRPELHARLGDRRQAWIAARSAALHDLGRRLHADVFQFSLPCLLRYADRNSMAFSIESRTPLLDYRLVEHIFALPLSMIMRGGWTKWVFRRAMEGRVPTAIQWRKDKMGFVTPEGQWLRIGKAHIRDVLGGSLVAERYLDPARVRQRVDAYINSTSDVARYTDVFRWYILELWMRQMFSAESP